MVLTVVAVAAAILLAGGSITAYERKQCDKRVWAWIHESYGRAPKKGQENYEDISIYWDGKKEGVDSSEKLDEITWNDLEMDQVFERMNSTASFAGEQVLYGKLHQILEDKRPLLDFEEKVTYFQNHEKEREEIQFLLHRMGKEKLSYYLPMFMKNLELQRIPGIWVYRVLQVLLVAGGISAVITGWDGFVFLVLCTAIINIFLSTVKRNQYEIYMESLGGMVETIRMAKYLIQHEALLGGEIPRHIRADADKLKKVSRRMAALQNRKQAGIAGDIGSMVQDYLVGATLWEFTEYDNVMEVLEGKQREFMELYEFLGELDAAISVASFRDSLEEYCMPEFSEGKEVVMEQIYHPLVEKPVKNDLRMCKNILLTGSNASGKSTFIKSVAVNLILAQSIHTCMAKRLRMPDARVLTSMAVRDDLLSGESYYMKEIRYLQRIIEESQKGRLVIASIDEILRGTNTAERIAASVAVLRYLEKKNCLVMVASHDLELGERLGQDYDLYYFCEKLQEKDVIFDYQIRKGLCNTRNAVNLLEKIGFPAEIVREAKKAAAL